MILYRVTTAGLGAHYVVAADPTSAYAKIRKDLDDRDYGFSDDRELDKIEPIADEAEYGTVKEGHDAYVRLYL